MKLAAFTFLPYNEDKCFHVWFYALVAYFYALQALCTLLLRKKRRHLDMVEVLLEVVIRCLTSILLLSNSTQTPILIRLVLNVLQEQLLRTVSAWDVCPAVTFMG